MSGMQQNKLQRFWSKIMMTFSFFENSRSRHGVVVHDVLESPALA